MDKVSFHHIVSILERHPIFHNCSRNKQADVWKQCFVAFRRLGTYGNANSLIRNAHHSGFAEGSVVKFTDRVITALLSLHGFDIKLSIFGVFHQFDFFHLCIGNKAPQIQKRSSFFLTLTRPNVERKRSANRGLKSNSNFRSLLANDTVNANDSRTLLSTSLQSSSAMLTSADDLRTSQADHPRQ